MLAGTERPLGMFQHSQQQQKNKPASLAKYLKNILNENCIIIYFLCSKVYYITIITII